MKGKFRRELTELLLCFGILGAVLLSDALGASGWARFSLPGIVRGVVYFALYLFAGRAVLREAWEGIRRGEILDECFLMAVATAGAVVLAVLQTGQYAEAVAVMLFYRVGEFLEALAEEKSRRNVRALMALRPDSVTLPDGTSVPPETVPVGTVFLVSPGQRVPLDGVVVSGQSQIDTSALTGESVPRFASAGETVLAGTVALSGVLTLRSEKTAGDSAVSRIFRLVRQAGQHKSRAETFTSRFSRIYTPAVCVGALALAVIPPAVQWLSSGAANWVQWIYRALTFLVISCPCALVVSVPLTYFAAIGGAGRRGILIKGARYAESLGKTKRVVWDKTGTLTKGVFQVTEVCPKDLSEDKLLWYAAGCEIASSHPVGKSIRDACSAPPDREQVTDIEERRGYGVCAVVDGIPTAVGSAALLSLLGIECPPVPAGGSVVFVAVDGRFAGSIRISDAVKPGSMDAVSALSAMGIRDTVMLTGDGADAARQIGEAVGISQIYSQLLPEDKVRRLEGLMSDGRVTVFVGDGINDAPVLTRADVGIAMGALGSDAAVEAADAVIMDDDPGKLPAAIALCRRCNRIVRQNVIVSLGAKLICLLLGALGLAGMPLAVFADVGILILCVGNALRML